MRVERALVGIFLLAAVAANGCGGRLAYNLPPSSRLMEPGPGVGGPGPGVIPPAGSPYGMYGGAVNRFGAMGDPGMGGAMGPGGYCATQPGMPMQAGGPMMGADIMQASYDGGCCEGGACGCGGDCGCGEGECTVEYPIDGNAMPIDEIQAGEAGGVTQAGFHGRGLLGHGGGCIRPGSVESYAGDGGGMGMATSQIAFLGDDGIQVSWDVGRYGMFDSNPLVIPARQDFYQAAIYRLRLSNLPGRPGVELFPTLEVAPVTPRTDAYLAHSPIPVQFTQEDLDQVVSGNFVTKVIYLPDPEFQELALAGVETLVSTRLGPGVDPIAEADRRGAILAILRMGNKDLRQNNMSEESFESEVVPASHKSAAVDSTDAQQALYNEELNAQGQPAEEGIEQVQYCGPYGGGYGDGSMGMMPAGMPTGGFAPAPMPPNMLAGGPQWGMPITGTPIGLPGPPHIPLGTPAGLQKHVMKNRTKVMMPPPNSKITLSVKQRPGLNYPRPVTRVHVDETNYEPFRILPGWMTGMFGHGGGGGGGGHDQGSPYCQ